MYSGCNGYILLKTIAICVTLVVVEPDINVKKPFGPKMCEHFCYQIVGCSSYIYSESDLSCHPIQGKSPKQNPGKGIDHINALKDKERMDADNAAKCNQGWKMFDTRRGFIKCISTTECYPGYRTISSVGMCVKFVTTKRNYTNASADCDSKPGGRVVHLDTDAKIAAIDAIHRVEYGAKFYIGLNHEPTYAPGDFRWSDGTPVTDSNWGTGQPDNRKHDDCVAILPWRDYAWADLYCSDTIFYICEIV